MRSIALSVRQCSVDRLVKPINQARARVSDQPNFTRLARLEAHSRSRRYVQAIPKSGPSIEGESGVRFSEMIMAADLDRSVARVCNRKRYCRSILVQDNLPRCWNNLARYHVIPLLLVNFSSNWVMKANELGAIREGCFHLYLIDHFGNAFHDLLASHDLAAFGHQF